MCDLHVPDACGCCAQTFPKGEAMLEMLTTFFLYPLVYKSIRIQMSVVTGVSLRMRRKRTKMRQDDKSGYWTVASNVSLSGWSQVTIAAPSGRPTTIEPFLPWKSDFDGIPDAFYFFKWERLAGVVRRLSCSLLHRRSWRCVTKDAKKLRAKHFSSSSSVPRAEHL